MNTKDSIMRFIEKGDVNNACRLVDLNPEIANNQKIMTEILKFASRHGHYKIIRHLPTPQCTEEILELIEQARIDAHRPMIRYLMSLLAMNFDYLNISDPLYQIVSNKIPERAKGSVYFPYIWEQLKCFFFVIKYADVKNLKNIPIRKTLKYLI